MDTGGLTTAGEGALLLPNGEAGVDGACFGSAGGGDIGTTDSFVARCPPPNGEAGLASNSGLADIELAIGGGAGVAIGGGVGLTAGAGGGIGVGGGGTGALAAGSDGCPNGEDGPLLSATIGGGGPILVMGDAAGSD